MTSATLTRRNQCVDLTTTEKSDQLPKKPMINERCPSEDSQYFSQWPRCRPSPRPGRALSYNEERTSTSSASNPNRLKHLCSTIKRRFSISKECRTRSDEINRSLSIRFSNYKSFSSTVDEPCHEFDWPDFESIYDSIPSCLANALPGMEDISIDGNDEDEDDDDDSIDTRDLMTDSSLEDSIEQMNRFKQCKRGHYFRRNGLCHKLDKTVYSSQLDTFIQQLMVEKLIRTWT